MQHFIPFTSFYACFLNNANLPPNLFSGYYFQNKHSVQVCVCVLQQEQLKETTQQQKTHRVVY